MPGAVINDAALAINADAGVVCSSQQICFKPFKRLILSNGRTNQ